MIRGGFGFGGLCVMEMGRNVFVIVFVNEKMHGGGEM